MVKLKEFNRFVVKHNLKIDTLKSTLNMNKMVFLWL